MGPTQIIHDNLSISRSLIESHLQIPRAAYDDIFIGSGKMRAMILLTILCISKGMSHRHLILGMYKLNSNSPLYPGSPLPTAFHISVDGNFIFLVVQAPNYRSSLTPLSLKFLIKVTKKQTWSSKYIVNLTTFHHLHYSWAKPPPFRVEFLLFLSN